MLDRKTAALTKPCREFRRKYDVSGEARGGKRGEEFEWFTGASTKLCLKSYGTALPKVR